MRIARIVVCFFVGALMALAQTDRGTITGTVTDPTGAVIANAPIEAKNTGTGQVYPVTSTATGNFTIVQLPPGTYELSANVQGFKKYVRQNLGIAPTQTLRLDIPLEVGSSAESVTVNADVTLLKTENGEVATNVTGDRLNNLPLLGIGEATASAAGIRNPWAVSILVPGVQYVVGGAFGGTPNIVVNGAAANSASYRIEGMDAGNNGSLNVFSMEVQPSAEAIQEVAVQTSNFAAEYGTVGGGLFNATMRSGTNAYHGSLYDYNVNEAYNAAQPYTGIKNRARRNDYGGSLGGPVRIPKVYNGTDRTFFYWNFEQYRESQVVSTTTVTVPTANYRIGDFSAVIPASGIAGAPQLLKIAGVNYLDPLGRTVAAGAIFDPASQRAVVCNTTLFPGANCINGQTVQVRDQFVGNRVDPVRFDTVAKNIQNLIPLPKGPGASLLGNNFNSPQQSARTTEIPSLKLDQTLGKGHLSFYWSTTTTADQYPIVGSPAQPEGFPPTISTVIANFDYSYTMRLNYDHPLTPSLLLHMGAGYQKNHLWDDTPITDYNAFKEIGLKGATVNRNFPRIEIGSSPTTGGMANMGAQFQTDQFVEKPTGNLSLTWVRNNHTFKAGGEFRLLGNPQIANGQPPWETGGYYTFGSPVVNGLAVTNGGGTTQTALDGLTTTGGSPGFGYANFLLGSVSSLGLGVPARYKLGSQAWAFFLQDTWKVTRKLTLDYGLRWDYGTYSREQYGRTAQFSATTPNPTADGHPGGIIYEATCNCKFAHNYPYALGPRVGVAYQLDSKTVLRGGFGVVYNLVTTAGFTPPPNYQTAGVPGFGQALFNLQDGPPSNVKPVFPNFSAGAFPLVNQTAAGPTNLDANAGRPARQMQWSIGIQRELTRNTVLEASYVANRGVWWSATLGGAGGLTPVNSMSEQLLTKYGFSLANPADAALLSTQLGQISAANKSLLAARGINIPYPSFPVTSTLLQSLLPFPQFTGNISPTVAPLGNTWYDSLQTTITQRLHHGLTVNGNFTWSKNLDLMSSPDIFNRSLGKNISANDLPLQLRISAQYTSPTLKQGFLGRNKIVSYILSDWGIGVYTQYQSAPIIARPASAGANGIQKWLGRGPGPAEFVTGQSFWSTNWTDYSGTVHTDPIDINCHCFDPTKNVVLNPNAWKNVTDGQWSSNESSFRDYRGIRYPTENANFSRTFRIREKMSLNIRGEFSNVLNRTRLPQPASGAIGAGFATAPTKQTSGALIGLYSGGFGTIVPTAGTAGARSGTIVARLIF
jgi:hypothetical protein